MTEIRIVPTGTTEIGDAFGTMIEVRILIAAEGATMFAPGTFWKPASEFADPDSSPENSDTSPSSTPKGEVS